MAGEARTPLQKILSRLAGEFSSGNPASERILPVLASVMPVDGLVLFTVAPGGGRVRVSGSLGLVDPGLLDGAQPDESALAAEARRALGRPFVNLNVRGRTDPFLESEKVRHLLLASQEAGRATYAAAALRRQGRPFTDAQAERFSAAASLVNLSLARRSLEVEIRHLKEHDPLTGLPSYTFFHDFLMREVARARRSSRPLTVGLMTLVGEIRSRTESAINQTLLEVASLLKAEFREFDMIARHGNLEFSFVLPELAGAHAAQVVERVLDSVRAKSGCAESWKAVVGLACYPQDVTTSERLIEVAEGALAEALEEGRTGVFRWVR